MITIDLRKQFKHLYQPSAKQFSIVDVPPLNFLMIDGAGNPNTSQDYRDALEALYGLSYTLKFGVKLGKYGKKKYDYPVMALEGLWWMDDMTRIQRDAQRRVEVDGHDDAAGHHHTRSGGAGPRGFDREEESGCRVEDPL